MFKKFGTASITKKKPLDLSDVTLAEILNSTGYSTGFFGKWHLGLEGPYRPENRGFDVALTSNTRYDYRKYFDPDCHAECRIIRRVQNGGEGV